jgi:hypothetical protein
LLSGQQIWGRRVVFSNSRLPLLFYSKLWFTLCHPSGC